MRDVRIEPRRRYAALALVVLAALAVGCASVNHLREAQEAFNEAVTLETTLRFDAALAEGPTQAQLAKHTTVQNGYASALLSLDRLESRDVDRLKRDGLWGNVLALKALAQWRLGLTDDAQSTARELQQTGAGPVHPRDRALLLALPGLIRTDEAFAALQRVPAEPSPTQRAATLRNVQLLVADAGEAIDRGRGAVDPAHPVAASASARAACSRISSIRYSSARRRSAVGVEALAMSHVGATQPLRQEHLDRPSLSSYLSAEAWNAHPPARGV